MSDTTKKANVIARSLFIIGGLILFIVLVVFIFKLIPILVSGVASLFNFGTQTEESIIISTDTDVAQNQKPVIVSIAYEPTQLGQYFVSYSCVEGLFFDIQSANGPRRIICDTPFRLGTNINSISLVPIVTKLNSLTDSTLKIEYKDEQNNLLDFGTRVLTITSEGASNATSTAQQVDNPFDLDAPLAGSTVTTSSLPTQTQTQTPAPTTTPRPVTTVSPTRDLTVTTITPIANQSAFVMHVYNYGNTATGPWSFTYTDAENPSRTVLSPVQGSLGRGQGMAVTVRFDGQVNSSQVIVVTLDPYNQIPETNISNNTATVTITGRTSGGNTGGTFNPNHRADLVITTMETGRMSGNRFVRTDSISKEDTGAIRFMVLNQGGEATGSWRFEARDLPFDSNSDRTYRSSTQTSLRPGEFREILVEFEGMREGRYNPEVFVDSDNNVREEKENNNRESERLDIDR